MIELCISLTYGGIQVDVNVRPTWLENPQFDYNIDNSYMNSHTWIIPQSSGAEHESIMHISSSR